MRIGVVVNPIAGLGGPVGLKGTDGQDIAAEARRRGAVPQAGTRVRRAFRRLADSGLRPALVAAPGELGADSLEGLGFPLEITQEQVRTGTAADTAGAVRAMGIIDLVVFGGGDGTARDVAAALPEGAAMLGIPCGVKMHSGVFALSPEAAGTLLADMLAYPDRIAWNDHAEVADMDEDSLRAGILAPRLYGHARAPHARSRMQSAKSGPAPDDQGELRAAAQEIAAAMQPGALYIIGPGKTAGLVCEALGLEPAILGVDAVLDGRLLARDASAAELERLAEGRPVRIILSVTGQQGFLLGRGNQQLTPDLVARAGRDGLIILAGVRKLAALAEPVLFVDTGRPELDAALRGFVRVQTGPGKFMQMRIRGG